MTLVDFLSAPWAIMPDRLLEMQAIYATHLRGDKIDIEAVEARLGRPLANEQQDYQLRDGGIAVLPVYGAIANKANMFMRISGGTSAQMLVKQIDSMAADPRVRGAVLEYDTPGGSVFGIPEAGAAIKRLSAMKPTASVSTGVMASAGYWLGSGANAVYASGPTDIIGSIGVVMTHNYNPRGNGGQTTEITAGKYKRMGSDTAPLDAEGKAYLQQQVDHLYGVFVDTVAENRGVSAQTVLERMADGRVFIGSQAKDAGLIDGFATVDDLVEQMATSPDKFTQRRKAVFALGGLPAPALASAADLLAGEAQAIEISGDGSGVALPAILAGAAALAASEAGPVLPAASETQPNEEHMDPKEIAAKFAADNPQAAAILRAEGSAGERDRIKAVREQSMPGHEALIDALAADGKTTGPEAAMQVLAAERARIATAGAQHLADAGKPVQTAAAETDPKTEAKPPVRQPNVANAYAGLNKARATA